MFGYFKLLVTYFIESFKKYHPKIRQLKNGKSIWLEEAVLLEINATHYFKKIYEWFLIPNQRNH